MARNCGGDRGTSPRGISLPHRLASVRMDGRRLGGVPDDFGRLVPEGGRSVSRSLRPIDGVRSRCVFLQSVGVSRATCDSQVSHLGTFRRHLSLRSRRCREFRRDEAVYVSAVAATTAEQAVAADLVAAEASALNRSAGLAAPRPLNGRTLGSRKIYSQP